jgi:hypothetical protein
MQTSQGYIFCILQHFATKFGNFTNFIMFFLTVAFYLDYNFVALYLDYNLV